MKITEALTERTSGLKTTPAGKMLQQAKVLPEDPNLVPRTHLEQGELENYCTWFLGHTGNGAQ